MAHDEDLLDVSVYSILDTYILEHVYPEQKVEKVDGSRSIDAHHLEKSSSPMPNEEPLIHPGSGIILLSYTPISVGMSAPPKKSETPLLLLEWLAPDHVKVEVESEQYLARFGEDESLGAKPKGEGEKTRTITDSSSAPEDKTVLEASLKSDASPSILERTISMKIRSFLWMK